MGNRGEMAAPKRGEFGDDMRIIHIGEDEVSFRSSAFFDADDIEVCDDTLSQHPLTGRWEVEFDVFYPSLDRSACSHWQLQYDPKEDIWGGEVITFSDQGYGPPVEAIVQLARKRPGAQVRGYAVRGTPLDPGVSFHPPQSRDVAKVDLMLKSDHQLLVAQRMAEQRERDEFSVNQFSCARM